MLDTVIKSGIPIIGVQTDDLVNFELVLQTITKAKPLEIEKSPPATLQNKYIYYTNSLDLVTVEFYGKLLKYNCQLIVVNPDKKSSLIVDAGIMPTPPELLEHYLKEVALIPPEQVGETMKVLKGMSLKTSSEIIMLTQARTGGSAINEIRRTRTLFGGSVQGLYPVDTDIDFYDMPKNIADWLALNENYFLAEDVPPKLRPRGLMLFGHPGTGKTMGAKAIANHFDVPLFRLDVATAMNRYIGESEARIARSLALIEKEAPCVLLIDEVEKIFSDKDDGGVTSRILSQLLWWLADHQSRVITIMTTNDLSVIPPELYREGRIDATYEIRRMPIDDAVPFGAQVYRAMLEKNPTTDQYADIRTALRDLEIPEHLYAHAQVAETVYKLIKLHGWYKPENSLTNQT